MKIILEGMILTNILIVEDESIVAMALQEMLERLGYHIIESVLSGEDAIKTALDLHPDLILMDIKLKGAIDGIDAAKQIQHHFDIPIIYLTAYGDEDTLSRAKQTEPFAYIIKPFNELSLRSSIEIALYQYQLKHTLKETTQHLENIINNISEILFSVNTKNQIVIWNASAEKSTGYKQKELRNIPIQELPFFENHHDLLSVFERIRTQQITPFTVNIHIRTKRGLKKYFRISSLSTIQNATDDTSEIVVVGKEITFDPTMMNMLSEGHSYLLAEKDPTIILRLLDDMFTLNFKCLYLSRSLSETIQHQFASNEIITYLLKDRNSKEDDVISDLDELQAKVYDFCSHNEHVLIAIGRIEYFLLRHSFEEIMIQLFKIADIIKDTRSVLLLHIAPGIFDKRQQAILENEFILLPSYNIDRISIKKDSYQILKFLSAEKQKNNIVTYKILKDEIHMTYPTINRKIMELEKNDLVLVFKQGRTKVIEITTIGENKINK